MNRQLLKNQLIRHGSENSLDKDAFLLINEYTLQSFPNILNDIKNSKKNELHQVCHEVDSIFGVNSNLIILNEKNKTLDWSFKGVVDETNNALYHTFDLHEQSFDACPVEYLLPRNQGLKFLRTIRGILSYFSRTEYREMVKTALHDINVHHKLDALQKIDISLIDDFGKNNKTEIFKFIAFQLAQTSALIFDQKELFTKNSAIEYQPSFEQYILRNPQDGSLLQMEINHFIEKCRPFVHVMEGNMAKFSFNQKEEIILIKEEKLIQPNPLVLPTHKNVKKRF